MTMSKLKLIKGGKGESIDEILACPRCNSTTLLPVVVGVNEVRLTDEGMLIRGGCDQVLCVQCLSEGEVSIVIG